MKKFFTISLLSVSLSSTLFAQGIKTEDFNYAAGQLTSLNSGANVSDSMWIGFSGTGKPLQVVAGSLTYTNYLTAPLPGSNHMVMDTTKISAEDAFFGFDSLTSGTQYCSFLLSVNLPDNLTSHDSANGDYFASFLPGNNTSGYFARVCIRAGSIPGTYNLGIAAQSTTSTPVNWTGADYLLNTTQLVTIGYEIIDGPNNDIAKLWVNPPNVTTEPAAQASSVFAVGTEPTNVKRIAFRQGYSSSLKGGTPKCQVDAIKISKDWYRATLPLELKSFSVIDNNGHASLAWISCNEVNMKEYQVQRSENAVDFATVGVVAATNIFGCNLNYTFTDAKMLNGTAYYRIKMLDKDGTASYSGVVSVDGKSVNNVSVFPNPVVNSIVVKHPKAEAGATIKVVSANGKVIMITKVQTGAIQTSIEAGALAKGNYFVVFENNNKKQLFQVTKF